jgi:HTH-type transcriptional regulator, competence development regulator
VLTKVNAAGESPLGGQLGLVRRARGESLKAVSLKAGISAAYLHKLERGSVQRPSPPVLAGLAAALGVEYQQLMELAGYAMPGRIALGRRRHQMGTLVTPSGAEVLTDDEARELAEYLDWRRHRRGSQ